MNNMDALGPGTLLRRAREAAGLTQKQVADHLRSSEEFISALENDEYNDDLGPDFVRAYLRAFAQLVGLSGQDVVSRYELVLDKKKSHTFWRSEVESRGNFQTQSSTHRASTYRENENQKSKRGRLPSVLLSFLFLGTIVYFGTHWYLSIPEKIEPSAVSVSSIVKPSKFIDEPEVIDEAKPAHSVVDTDNRPEIAASDVKSEVKASVLEASKIQSSVAKGIVPEQANQDNKSEAKKAAANDSTLISNKKIIEKKIVDSKVHREEISDIQSQKENKKSDTIKKKDSLEKLVVIDLDKKSKEILLAEQQNQVKRDLLQQHQKQAIEDKQNLHLLRQQLKDFAQDKGLNKHKSLHSQADNKKSYSAKNVTKSTAKETNTDSDRKVTSKDKHTKVVYDEHRSKPSTDKWGKVLTQTGSVKQEEPLMKQEAKLTTHASKNAALQKVAKQRKNRIPKIDYILVDNFHEIEKSPSRTTEKGVIVTTDGLEIYPLAQTHVHTVPGLTLKFYEDCWVEIKDANKRRLALGVYKKGKKLEVRGTEPYSIHLGNAHGVSIALNGVKALEAGRYEPHKVARLIIQSKRAS